MNGRLIGVGLGPGDPDLLTVRAARLIASAPVISYPAPVGAASFARSIAASLIAPGTREIVIEVPMSPDPGPAQSAYDRGAAAIAAVLEQGSDVVSLCEGDPLFHGSFMYLLERLSPRFETSVVPGVSSLAAVSAALKWPMARRNEVVSILPAPLDNDALRRGIAGAETVAIIKLGRHLARIRALIAEMGLTGSAGYVGHASLQGQIACALEAAPSDAPYFSMILIVKGA